MQRSRAINRWMTGRARTGLLTVMAMAHAWALAVAAHSTFRASLVPILPLVPQLLLLCRDSRNFASFFFQSYPCLLLYPSPVNPHPVITAIAHPPSTPRLHILAHISLSRVSPLPHSSFQPQARDILSIACSLLYLTEVNSLRCPVVGFIPF
jgi:hypothetical protein